MMATTALSPSPTRSVFAVGASRARYELVQYVRSGQTLFFTFLFPLFMLGLFSVAFGSEGDVQIAPDAPAISMAQFFLPGMVASGMLLSGFQNLGIDIAVDRSEGVLKRLGRLDGKLSDRAKKGGAIGAAKRREGGHGGSVNSRGGVE